MKKKQFTRKNRHSRRNRRAGVVNEQLVTNNLQIYNSALLEILRGIDAIKYNNYFLDLEKEIVHCKDIEEKKRLLKEAHTLHKKLYPSHKHYNKYLKHLETNINISRDGRFTIIS